MINESGAFSSAVLSYLKNSDPSRKPLFFVSSILLVSNDLLDLSCPVNDSLTFFEGDLLAENTALYVVGVIDDVGAGGAENLLNLLFSVGILFAVNAESYVSRAVGIQLGAETSYLVVGFSAKSQADQNQSFLVSRICRRNVVCKTSACLTRKDLLSSVLPSTANPMIK